jgi:hypothetical protein
VELLNLHDAVDLLDEEIRLRRTVLVLTSVVSTVLAAPLLIVLFLNDAPFFAAYPTTFVIVLGAILCAVTVERSRLRAERDAIRDQIHQIEVAPEAGRVTLLAEDAPRQDSGSVRWSGRSLQEVE